MFDSFGNKFLKVAIPGGILIAGSKSNFHLKKTKKAGEVSQVYSVRKSGIL